MSMITVGLIKTIILKLVKNQQEELNNILSYNLKTFLNLTDHITGTNNNVESCEAMDDLLPNGELEKIAKLQITTEIKLRELSVLCQRLIKATYNNGEGQIQKSN